jgi:hypothetical protein
MRWFAGGSSASPQLLFVGAGEKRKKNNILKKTSKKNTKNIKETQTLQQTTQNERQ